MKPSNHIIASASIGVIFWIFTKSLYAGLVCFVSGLALDADHVLEYVIHYGWKGVTFKKMYDTCEQTMFKKLYLVLHGIEISIFICVAAVLTKNIYLYAVALGYSLHLAMDASVNRLYPVSYFIIWRAVNKFDTSKMLREKWRK